jgi:hypothetical protein
MFYYYTEELHFSPKFLGSKNLAEAIAALLGVTVYNIWLKNIPIRRMFLANALIGCILSLSQVSYRHRFQLFDLDCCLYPLQLLLLTRYNQALGISDKFFCVMDSFARVMLGEICGMPTMVVAARACPEGYEVTIHEPISNIEHQSHVSSLGIYVCVADVVDRHFGRYRRRHWCR